MKSLYDNNSLSLADDKLPFDFDDNIFHQAADVIYKNKGFNTACLALPEVQRLINETYRHLSAAIDTAVTDDTSQTVRYALENNAFIFSGFKTLHSLQEVGLSMIDEDNNIKSFDAFYEDVKKINNQYNRNYLRAEYHHAKSSALMAVRWHKFQEDGDKYYLQYRTAQDERVREKHAILHGITLPANDPFWNDFLPPLGWGCRCSAVQVRKGKYPVSDSDKAILQGMNCTNDPKLMIFRFNSGKELALFPSKHPYYKVQNAQQVTQAINGYIPETWTPKTVKEAEQFFRDKLGVNCSLKGFKAADMDMIESLFRSVETHFQMFPELKQETKFVGSIQGRIQLITEKKIEEYKIKFPYLSDKQIKDAALKYARYIASVRNCYAYSHGACSDIGLSGIAWNTNWTGDKFQKNKELAVNTQFAPIGTASVKGVVDHELGHEIDRLLGLCSHGDFIKLRSKEIANGKKYIKENLSDYANTNAAEFIAEAWSEYLNNKKPRPIAVAVGSLIRKLYTKKYQSSNA